MRSLAALISITLLAACNGTPAPAHVPAQPHQAAADGPVEFLLTSSASDFQAHRPPFPRRFRNVRIGYVPAPDGSKQYMLCGSFLPSADGRDVPWLSFVTIKTSGYEQYIGAQAEDFCRRASVVWLDGDFSSSLQNRLASQH